MHDRQRLLQEGRPGRRHRTTRPTTRAGASRPRSTSTRCRRPARTATSCSCRATTTAWTTWASPWTPPCRSGAKFVSNSYGVLGEDPDETAFDHYYDHPGVAVTASHRRHRQRDQLAGDQPERGRASAARRSRRTAPPRGWTGSRLGRRRLGMLAVRAEAGFPGRTWTPVRDRAIADVSADADPNTGLPSTTPSVRAVAAGRRHQPVVAAGRGDVRAGRHPVAGTYPVCLPLRRTAPVQPVRRHRRARTAAAATCSARPDPAGTARPGSAPPNGVTALPADRTATSPATVTDAVDRCADRRARPSRPPTVLGDHRRRRPLQPESLPVGSYDVTAQAFGYASQDRPAASGRADGADDDRALRPAPACRATRCPAR